ncbi:unnamed protein product, partial [Cylicocyclus nassatus]
YKSQHRTFKGFISNFSAVVGFLADSSRQPFTSERMLAWKFFVVSLLATATNAIPQLLFPTLWLGDFRL